MAESVTVTQEQMDALLKQMSKDVGDKKSPKKKGSSKKKVNKPAVELEQVVDPNVWKEIHVFMQPGESLQGVQRAARYEKEDRGASVLVFMHEHVRGEACTPKCKERE